MSLARARTTWDEEEVKQLLSEVYRQKSFKEIAAEHKRSAGAIKAQLKKMAADYWFHDWRTIEQIITFTGLTKKEVETAIKQRYATYPVPLIGDSGVAELKQEILTMKQDMKEILTLMNAIYSFETLEPPP
jgi:hypothetical protein